jgi:hypothetical protein
MRTKVRSPAARTFDVVFVGLVEPHSKAFLARLLSDGGGVALPKTGPRGASPFGGRIVVDIAVADGGDRTPEFVVVFCVKHRDQRIFSGDRRKCEQAGAVDEAEFPGLSHRADDGIVAPSVDHQPKACILGLPCGALGAGAAAEFFDLIVVGSPFRTVERDRRNGAELRRAGQRERPDLRPLRGRRGSG